MAEITKSAKASLATVLVPAANKISGLLADEDIGTADACVIKANGRVARSTGAANNAAAKYDGFAGLKAKSGEAVTLFKGVEFEYGTGLTPGTNLFVSGTVPGGLADAASTGGLAPVARVVTPTRIRVFADVVY